MKIFQKVHCMAYLKKHSDGVALSCYVVDRSGAFEMPAQGSSWKEPIKVIATKTEYKDGKWTQEDIADLSEFEGESVDKQYRVRVEEEFDGFLVGMTNIVTTGQIGTDMTMHPYNMDGDLEEIYHLTKTTNKEKVGVVYFKNNAKRYVLPEDMRGEQDG